MKSRLLIAILSAAGLAVGVSGDALGAVITLSTNHALHEDWSTLNRWSDNQAAQSGNDYHVGDSTGKTMRTPESANPVFPGDSLTIHTTGVMGLKNNGTVTVADLHLDGGKISHWVGNRTIGVSGTITVDSNSTLDINTDANRIMQLAGTVKGPGNLTATGPGVFGLAGDLRVGSNAADGTLIVNTIADMGTGSQTLDIGVRDTASTDDTQGTIDLSDSPSVTIDVADLRLGVIPGNISEEGDTQGILTLSQNSNNTITATNVLVGDSSHRSNTDFVSELDLGGATNTINANLLRVGGRKAKGKVTMAAGGTLSLSGDSNAAADLQIGENYISTGTTSIGVVDLSGGTFNAALDDLYIARHGGSSGNAEGTLIMDAGTVTVNDVAMAVDTGSDQANTTAVLTMNGGTVTVASNITDGGGVSTLNVHGGALNMTAGAITVDQLSLRNGDIQNATTATLQGTGDALILEAGRVDFDVDLVGASGGRVVVTGTGSSRVDSSDTIDLGGMSREFNIADVAGGSDLFVFGNIANGGVIKTGAGTLKYQSNPKTYTGLTDVQEGELFLQFSGNWIPDGNDIQISGGTLNLNQHNETVHEVTLLDGTIKTDASSSLSATYRFWIEDGTVNGNLGGPGYLWKDTNATVTLSGTNTYTGTTDVVAGTLLVNGTTSGQGSYTVHAGATLGGSGSIGLAAGESVTVLAGGTISAGISPGTLIVGGDMILAESAIINWEYANGMLDRDLLAVTGDLQLPFAATLNVIDFGGGSLQATETLFSAGSFSGAPDLSGWTINVVDYEVVISGDQVVLQSTAAAIPEPMTMLAVGLGISSLGGYIRKRRRA